MKPIRRVHEFKEDEEGATLVLWGVMFIILFGLVAMSFDMGRIGVTRSELQSYADNAALAAAGELTGAPGSRAKARAAAESLITDFQTFGVNGQVLGGASDLAQITFHYDLPDKVLGATQFVATSDEDALYVRVQVTEQQVPFTFGRAFNALTGTPQPNNDANAFAVAGMSSYACDAVQLWFCLPSAAQPTDEDDPSPIPSELNLRVGEMIHMVAGTSDGQYGPGNWGFIEESILEVNEGGPCDGLSGTGPRLRCILGAAENVGKCINGRFIDTEPGIKTGITGVSINTRFDIYEGSMQSAKNDPDYAPAPVVTKGIKPKGGGSCIKNNVEATTNTAAFGRDECFIDPSVNCRDGRFGDGEWDFEAYMSANYDTDGSYDFDTGVDSDNYAEKAVEYPDWYASLKPTATSPNPTRWEVYQREVYGEPDGLGGYTDSLIPGGLPDLFSTSAATDVPREEDGLPSCSTSTPLTGGLLGDRGERRRIMIAAAVDCSNQTINGSATGVRVSGYVEFFLTEPAANDPNENGNQVNVWAEVVDVHEAGEYELISVLREVPQLVD